jgi:hypothetical protein|tara:strand:+ start:654 stop:956 length:303 start_codon:yes stop_codon:yes gene_type:complete
LVISPAKLRQEDALGFFDFYKSNSYLHRQDNHMNSISVDDLNVIDGETLVKLEELKESVPAPAIENVAGGRLATKKSLTRRIPEFFSSLDPPPPIIRLKR